jgi:hypothetical protein
MSDWPGRLLDLLPRFGRRRNLIARAALEGRRAARSGQYDQWSFADPIAPGLQRLIQEEIGAVAQQHLVGINRSSELKAEAAAATAERQRDTQQLDTDVSSALESRREQERARDRTLVDLDRLTGVHLPLPADVLDPDASQPSPYEAVTVGTDPPVQDGPANPYDVQQMQARRWMGPADGKLPPPVPLPLKLVLIVLLAGIEIPVYFAIFKPFHPRDLDLVWCFTVPVAAAMVLGPHLAGLWLRHQVKRPGKKWIPAVSVSLLMTVWFVASLLLADMRRHSLLGVTIFDGVEIASPMADLDPRAVTAVFATVLILSGLISFLLGLSDEHPDVTAYRIAARRTDAAAQRHWTAVRARAGAHLEPTLPLEERLDALRAETAQQVTRIRSQYQAARAAYLDGVAKVLADPSVTHAVALTLTNLSNTVDLRLTEQLNAMRIDITRS